MLMPIDFDETNNLIKKKWQHGCLGGGPPYLGIRIRYIFVVMVNVELLVDDYELVQIVFTLAINNIQFKAKFNVGSQ